MPEIPQFPPDGPPAIFFLGGYPGLALIATYAIGAIPSRHAFATVGNSVVGKNRWPVGGLLARKLVTIRREIVFPDTAYPCHGELRALIEAIAQRHPVRLVKKPTMSPQNNINERRRAMLERTPSGAELFGGRISSFVPIYIAVSEIATSRMLIRALGTLESTVHEALWRFEKIGMLMRIGQAPQRTFYWSLNPAFFAYRELQTLLSALAREYRPEYFAIARHANDRDPRIEMHTATLRELERAHNLAPRNDIQSVPGDIQSLQRDSQ